MTGLRAYLFLATLVYLVNGACVDGLRVVGTHRLQDEVGIESAGRSENAPQPKDAGAPDSDTALYHALELEEGSMEDPAALSALIAERNASQSDSPGTLDDGPPARSREPLLSDIGVPPAAENLALSGKACLERLRRLKVPFVRPSFSTPLIETPVLLTGELFGVQIGPRFTDADKPTNAVMDCHLALAMVQVARHASALGVSEIAFYSTYRPLKPPPRKCPKGKKRQRCLEKRRRYQKIVAAQKSQHRFGRAIDIRWLTLEDGRTIDVLTDFDRRSGTPPCSYTPTEAPAALLSEFVCGLHRYRLFNVMLTPNANKAHHNHFHFDLTPNATWYIIR